LKLSTSSDSLAGRSFGSVCHVGAFGRVRRSPAGKRGAFLLGRLVEAGGGGIRVRRLGQNRAGEIRLTRFLRNPVVRVEEMVSEAAARVTSRCAGRHVLAIQDTTVVRSQGGGGLYLHPTLAVDGADGAILGVIHAEFLTRTEGVKATRRKRRVRDKESGRWLRGADRAAAVCAEAARVTVIADRESDIYEAFADCPAGVELLVRAAHDRSVDEEAGRLFGHADGLPEAARAGLDVPAKAGRRARRATLALRFGAVRIARPRNGLRAGLPASLDLWLVDAREVDPPAGERPIHWLLLGTRPVRDLEAAREAIELYRRRWNIEQVFRTLKTKGFDIEAVRIEAERPLCNLIMASLVAAVVVQQLVHGREGDGQRPLTEAFDASDQPLLEAFCARLEGKTQRQKNPHPVGSLPYAAWVCARLGGWTGYYGKPGPIVMLRGWLEFHAARRGIEALGAFRNV